MDYQGNLVTMARYEESYTMVGGINAPKKIKCLGSDGRWEIQLVKGTDDLRQDAVMQQVFGLVNGLLAADGGRDTRFRMRQYNVSRGLHDS